MGLRVEVWPAVQFAREKKLRHAVVESGHPVAGRGGRHYSDSRVRERRRGSDAGKVARAAITARNASGDRLARYTVCRRARSRRRNLFLPSVSGSFPMSSLLAHDGMPLASDGGADQRRRMLRVMLLKRWFWSDQP